MRRDEISTSQRRNGIASVSFRTPDAQLDTTALPVDTAAMRAPAGADGLDTAEGPGISEHDFGAISVLPPASQAGARVQRVALSRVPIHIQRDPASPAAPPVPSSNPPTGAPPTTAPGSGAAPASPSMTGDPNNDKLQELDAKDLGALSDGERVQHVQFINGLPDKYFAMYLPHGTAGGLLGRIWRSVPEDRFPSFVSGNFADFERSTQRLGGDPVGSPGTELEFAL